MSYRCKLVPDEGKTGVQAGRNRRQAGDHGGHCHIYISTPPNGGVGGGTGEVFSSVFRFFGASCGSCGSSLDAWRFGRAVLCFFDVGWVTRSSSLLATRSSSLLAFLARVGLGRAADVIPVGSNPAGSSSTSWRRLDRMTMVRGPAGFIGRSFEWRAGRLARDCCRRVSPRSSKGADVSSTPPWRLRFALGASASLLARITSGDAARLGWTTPVSVGDLDRRRGSFGISASSFVEGLQLLCRDAMGLEGPEAVTP